MYARKWLSFLMFHGYLAILILTRKYCTFKPRRRFYVLPFTWIMYKGHKGFYEMSFEGNYYYPCETYFSTHGTIKEVSLNFSRDTDAHFPFITPYHFLRVQVQYICMDGMYVVWVWIWQWHDSFFIWELWCMYCKYYVFTVSDFCAGDY